MTHSSVSHATQTKTLIDSASRILMPPLFALVITVSAINPSHSSSASMVDVLNMMAQPSEIPFAAP